MEQQQQQQQQQQQDGVGSGAIIMDYGSGQVKVGFAGEESPRAVFPASIGKPIDENVVSCYPIEHGVVTNWDDMERVWQHAFEAELNVSSEEHCVLLTECPLVSEADQEKTAEIMFEKFHVPAMCATAQAELSLYACGRETGIVIDSGDGVTHTVPIYQGNAITDAILQFDLSGRDVTDYLLKMLCDNNNKDCCNHLTPDTEINIVCDIKEKLCYVAVDYEAEILTTESSSSLEMTYELPDGTVITVEEERFKCCEAMFQPSFLGLDCCGIDEIAYKSISKCEVEIQTQLFANIVLTGGNTMFPGLDDRLQKEINALAPPGTKVEVIALPDRKHAAWTGGSIVANLSSFTDMCVTQQEYEEYGPTIVHKKCSVFPMTIEAAACVEASACVLQSA